MAKSKKTSTEGKKTARKKSSKTASKIVRFPRVKKKEPVTKMIPIPDITSVSIITVRRIELRTDTGHFVRIGTGGNGSGRAARFLSDGEADRSVISHLVEDFLDSEDELDNESLVLARLLGYRR